MKTPLKIIIVITLLLNTCFLFSQEVFLKKSLDWSMLLNGPGHSYEQTSTYNYELGFGFEWERDRVLIGLEDHEAIDYRKWFLEYDKKLTSGRFNFYAGVEFGGIWRTKKIQLQNYNVEVTDMAHSITVGVNLETQVRITKHLYWSINFNLFTRENKDFGESTKFTRSDIMSGGVVKLGI